MNLRFADDSIINITGKEQLSAAVASLNNTNDFAVLDDGENFIQTAYNDGTFYVTYRDTTGIYESSDGKLPLETVQDLFTRYWSGDTTWKTMITWETQGGGSPSDIPPASRPGDIKDELLHMAKRSVVNWIKKKIR